MRKSNARILALALILVFTQKLGLGIWMHNWLHETGAHKEVVLHGVTVTSSSCHCIDDFLIPLVETPVVTVPVPVREFVIIPFAYRSDFPTVFSSFASLRGPPAVAISC